MGSGWAEATPGCWSTCSDDSSSDINRTQTLSNLGSCALKAVYVPASRYEHARGHAVGKRISVIITVCTLHHTAAKLAGKTHRT